MPRARQYMGAAVMALVLAAAWHLYAAPLPVPHEDWWTAEEVGGNATVYSFGESPYNRAAPGLSLQERTLFSRGSTEFNTAWVPSGTVSEAGRTGLGPRFNAESCGACHYRNGRGLVTDGPFSKSPIVMSADEGLSLFKMVNGAPQRRYEVSWGPHNLALPNGTSASLWRPDAYEHGTRGGARSLRHSPGVYGLGLLEAIDETQLRKRAADAPYKRYGVTGRIRTLATAKGPAPGRFGWKAEHASLEDQVIAALAGELGVSSHGHRASGDPDSSIEAQKETVDDLVFYMRLIGVPARRNTYKAELLRGAEIFTKSGCTMCHTPAHTTRTNGPHPLLSGQKIYPFTDLLLHDMGEELAGGKGPWRRFWRTPPLWGIGAQAEVSTQAGYLHDGRARTLEEAVLWHGGEASWSRSAFVRLSAAERDLVVKFLKSL